MQLLPYFTRINGKKITNVTNHNENQFQSDIEALISNFNPHQKMERIVIFRQIVNVTNDKNEKTKEGKQIECFCNAQSYIPYNQFKVSFRKLVRIEAFNGNLRSLPIPHDLGVSLDLKNKIEVILKLKQHIFIQDMDWCLEILKKEQEYGDFLFQIQTLYNFTKKICNQNYQCCVLLHQNFQQNSCLLMHVASFVQALLCKEIEDNKIIDFPKIMYFNLTGQDKQENLYFWSKFNSYHQNYCKYFTFNIQNIGDNSVYSSQEFKNARFAPLNKFQIFIPLIFFQQEATQQSQKQNQFEQKQQNGSQFRAINKYQMKILFDFLIRKEIIDFKPSIIYVDMLISLNLIELEAQERILRKLSKYAKVIVHFKFDKDENNPSVDTLLSQLNVIFNGLQSFKKIHTEKINTEEQQKIVEKWLSEMNKYYQKQNPTLSRLFQTERQLQLTRFRTQKLQELQQNIYLAFPEQMQVAKIEAKFSKYSINFHQLAISYEHKIVVLQNFEEQKVYSANFAYQQQQQLNFKQININEQGPQQEYITVSQITVLIYQSFLLFAYKGCQNSNGNNYTQDQILYYEMTQDSPSPRKLSRATTEYANQFQDQLFYQYTQEGIKANIVEKRRGQSVCYHSIHPIEGFVSFMLIGGESWNSFTIMDVIECVYVDVSTGIYFSKIINRSRISIMSSIRPQPNMLILELKKTNLDLKYLLFQGNQLSRHQYYYSFLNPKYQTLAQLLIFQKDHFKLLNIEVKQEGFRIEEYMNNDYNQQLIPGDNTNITTWKVVTGRLAIIKKANYLSKYYQDFFKRFSTGYLCLEFTIQLIAEKVNDSTKWTVQITSKPIS